MGSSKSKTIFAAAPRWAYPITSLTCTSRQARTHRVHWMHASSRTVIPGCERSGSGCARVGNRPFVTPRRSAHSVSSESVRYVASGVSLTRSSSTIRCDARARSLCVWTTIPSLAVR